ncbi:TRAP transporter large permease subunit [Belnapia sp. T6]|uniref:TRAP transporter large permease subunit n=1 Tax=Belnapia mucosa TaxID=2804532 RepID=A0ABS1UZC0_9PROT|nr:TRAP transporter large permease subunit [Belnapia mucosa]MBL6454357.1 TRAP transporter large permease subunit [Belnapia mucosa]
MADIGVVERRPEGRVEALLGGALELVAAALVAVETVLLLAGIIARYVFHSSLVWSDELASVLFLWLAMLGAVVAFRRAEHMRMTALVTMAPAPLRGFLEALAVAAPILFLLLLLHPAYDYAVEESFIVTPAMEIPGSWRAAALPVGLGLMLLVALVRLPRVAGWGRGLAALALVALVAAGFWWAGPAFRPLGNLNLVIFFVGLVAATVLAGVPIAFCFGLATFGYLALTTRVPVMVVVGRMDEGMSHLILLAVPLFIFLGSLIEMTGMARAMIRFLANLLGHVRGGLSYVLVGAMYLVSGISGAKAADMAAVAPVLFPEMRQRGAKPGELVALLSATGAQTETVPPSLVLITIGSVTGVSIGALFTGGLLPGALLAVVLCLVVWWRHRGLSLAGAAKPGAGEILRSLGIALPALALPFLIRAAVVEGVATATEVSTIGIAYAFIVGLVFYRQFDWSRLRPMLVDTAALSGAILLIIGAATGMAWALTQSGFSRQLAAAMAALPGGQAGFLAVSILAFVVLGSVLEGIPAIVLFGPLLFPIARDMGVHEVHYAMVVILSMGIGLFAPPFGVGYYAACAISRISPDEGMRAIWGYMLALLVGTAVIAAIPWISIGFL